MYSTLVYSYIHLSLYHSVNKLDTITEKSSAYKMLYVFGIQAELEKMTKYKLKHYQTKTGYLRIPLMATLMFAFGVIRHIAFAISLLKRCCSIQKYITYKII